jgi:hypothetical protein
MRRVEGDLAKVVEAAGKSGDEAGVVVGWK